MAEALALAPVDFVAPGIGLFFNVAFSVGKGIYKKLKKNHRTKQLIKGTINGNHDKVHRAILRGADVDARNYGKTCLYIASENGNLEIVVELIKGGANVHATNTNNGYPSLHIALEKCHADIVRELIKAGGN